MSNSNKTRAEQLMDQRAYLPQEASPRMVRSVSQHRREMLQEDFERGDYREMGEFSRWPDFRRDEEMAPIYRKRENATGLTAAGHVATNSKGLRKMAQQSLSSGPVGSSG